MMKDGDADIIRATPDIIKPVKPLQQQQQQQQKQQQQQQKQKSAREERSVLEQLDSWEIPPMSSDKAKVNPCFKHVRQSFMGPVEETYNKKMVEKQQVCLSCYRLRSRKCIKVL